MAFISRLRTQILSWWQDTPLPAGTDATFQSWHEFDDASKRWRPVETTREGTASPDNTQTQQPTDPSSTYNLVTWNVDYSSPNPAQRLSAILSHTLSLSPPIDIIFLQELSRDAVQFLLASLEIRQNWLLTDADGLLPPGQSFTTITLLSKTRLPHPNSPNPGPVWRVKYPTRFGRDALCCDIFLPSSSGAETPVRLRLINVHLDSLPIQPSLRPQQVAAVAALLRSARRGVVAGDFNPVLPGDENLVQENGLVDAWTELRPGEPGFTWGVDGKEPFPANRMDKVAVVGVRVVDVEVLAPGEIEGLPWSDHSGVRCLFRTVEP